MTPQQKKIRKIQRDHTRACYEAVAARLADPAPFPLDGFLAAAAEVMLAGTTPQDLKGKRREAYRDMIERDGYESAAQHPAVYPDNRIRATAIEHFGTRDYGGHWIGTLPINWPEPEQIEVKSPGGLTRFRFGSRAVAAATAKKLLTLSRK